jgi:hypothetical protein
MSKRKMELLLKNIRQPSPLQIQCHNLKGIIESINESLIAIKDQNTESSLRGIRSNLILQLSKLTTLYNTLLEIETKDG